MSKYILNFLMDLIPQGFSYTLVALLAVCFIIYYLYKSSDFFTERVFNVSAIITVSLFLTTNLILWLSQRPTDQKQRLAIFPIDVSECVENDKWMGWAISEAVGDYFQRGTTSEFIIYPVDWLQPIINSDSLKFESYLKSFSSRVRIDYYFSGSLLHQDNSYYLQYHLHSSDKLIDSARMKIDCNDHYFGLNIARRIKSHLREEIEINGSNRQNIEQLPLKNYILGKFALLADSASQAIEYLELATKYDSSFSRSFTYLAAANLQLGLKAKKSGHSSIQFYKSAKNCLEIAQKLNRSDSQNNIFYAKYYILMEKWNHAETILRQLITQDPNNPYSYLYLTQLHPSRYMDLDFKNEEELLRHALYLFPGFVEAAISLSDYYYNYLQDSKKAIEILQQMLTINPNQIAILTSLGKLYIAANQALPVMTTFKKIIEIDPLNSGVYYNLGIFYYNSEDYETALKLFKRAIKIDNHLDSHLYLAYIYEKMHKTEESHLKRKEHLNKAIEHLRIRIRNRRGQDDLYAETARKHLFYLLHQ